MKNYSLTDQHGREIHYLRLSVTDRCNFRCQYCMPEEGMEFASSDELLSFDELFRISQIFCGLGITKIRITGGEPLVRKGVVPFMEKIRPLDGLKELTMTTNATLLAKHMKELTGMGIHAVNVSLDSLDAERFYNITRRDQFNTVYQAVMALLQSGIKVKINCVMMEGKNEADLIPFVEFTREHPVAVRFLEEMPFNGSHSFDAIKWNYREIYNFIHRHYPSIEKLPVTPASTSVNYRIPGYKGTFGIIASFSRTFCGSCDRIRLSAKGDLRTCLYGPPTVNLRDLIRMGVSNDYLETAIVSAVHMREKDGRAAEALNKQAMVESMSVLGG